MSHDTAFIVFASNLAAVVMEWSSVAVVVLWSMVLECFAAAYDAAPSQIVEDATRAMRLELFCEDRMALDCRPKRKMPKLEE